jgi:hypothetical protein
VQRSYTITDEHGVVHALPDNWGVRSFKAVCGYTWQAVKHPRPFYETDNAITCLMCLVSPPKVRAGATTTGLFMWSQATGGRSYSLRAVATLFERDRTVMTVSSTPTKPRRA